MKRLIVSALLGGMASCSLSPATAGPAEPVDFFCTDKSSAEKAARAYDERDSEALKALLAQGRESLRGCAYFSDILGKPASGIHTFVTAAGEDIGVFAVRFRNGLTFYTVAPLEQGTY